MAWRERGDSSRNCAGMALAGGRLRCASARWRDSVRSAAKGLASGPGVGDMEPSKIQDLFFRRLYINYSENVKAENVKITRIDNGWNMKVNYEVRRPLVGNLDVVGVFDVDQNLTRGGGTD